MIIIIIQSDFLFLIMECTINSYETYKNGEYLIGPNSENSRITCWMYTDLSFEEICQVDNNGAYRLNVMNGTLLQIEVLG